MAKRKEGVGRSTDIARELAERNRELEEEIRALKSGDADQERPTSAGELGESAGELGESAGGSAGELGEEAGAKSWVNEQGNLCIGRKCIVTEATPEGLRFKLDADTCDPATRDAFIAAMIKGTRMTFNE